MRVLWCAMLIACGLLLSACASAPTAAKTSDFRKKLESADLALREARLDDAEVMYRQLSASHPRLPDVWLNLGNIYMRQSQVEAAVQTYKQGLRHAPDDGRLWYNLSLAELKRSVQTLETASSMLPADSPYRARIQNLHRALLTSASSNAEDDAP